MNQIERFQSNKPIGKAYTMVSKDGVEADLECLRKDINSKI